MVNTRTVPLYIQALQPSTPTQVLTQTASPISLQTVHRSSGAAACGGRIERVRGVADWGAGGEPVAFVLHRRSHAVVAHGVDD